MEKTVISPNAVREVMKGIIFNLENKPIIVLEPEDKEPNENSKVLGFAFVSNRGNPITEISLEEIYLTISGVDLRRQLFIVLKDGKLNIRGNVYDAESDDEIETVSPLLKMFMEGVRVVQK